MIRFIITAVLTGLLFGVMDGMINGNPLATQLFECYKPIAKQTINVQAGIVIDMLYGFVISGIYLILMPSLPTDVRIVKGLTYGLGMWFFRVFMGVVSDWMMFDVPAFTLFYLLITGLIEMVILGVINGLILKK